jgi:hypothetical protein
MTTLVYSLLVQVDGRWTVVAIDAHANQVTVPALGNTRFYVSGTDRAAIETAACYTNAHRPRRAYGSRAKAEAALHSEGRRVWEDRDGDLRVDVDESIEVSS